MIPFVPRGHPRRATLFLTAALLIGTPALAQPAAPAAPQLAEWQPWVLRAPDQFRLPPPPSAAATRAELEELRRLAASRDAEAQERIAWWNAVAPSYRWNQIAVQEAVRGGVNINVASRRLAILHTALDDAMQAAWANQQAYRRARPAIVQAAIPVPATPSYPDEHAVAAAVASAVLGTVFPDRAAEMTRLAEESGRMRLLAGVAHPSDVAAGAVLGRQVAEAALERARRDRTDQPWTGAVPAGPGRWTGTNPAMAQAAGWLPWLMASPGEFRPGPPPAHDSPERAAELAQLRGMARTPLTTARAIYWEAAAGGLRSHEYWNGHAARLLMEHGQANDPRRAARAFALVNVALYDAGVACWDAKDAYWAARPHQSDPEIRPVLPVPNHSSYPSAHGCFSTAAAMVLAHLFPRDGTAVTALAREAGESRLWAGFHTASDVSAAEAIARRVAERAIQRARGEAAMR
ncbi:MAG TPA: phosphatase PAP2 family protein [Acetobacteraceae bacterium]|nr:phosphatase PAP2 family protein [Acetobacteraceae bacterium]